MAASNPAVGARPGWRGTDPDGGTWVRCPHGLPGQWAHFTADGKLVFRSQEEAEAAGLVPLPAPAEPGQFWVLVGGKSPAAAPAPLDPGNPEHLRQVADVLDSVGRPETARWIRSEADRLDREAREKAQDASDRKRAEEYARTEAEGEHRALGGWSAMRADIREWHIALALRAIRAERARAAEVKS